MHFGKKTSDSSKPDRRHATSSRVAESAPVTLGYTSVLGKATLARTSLHRTAARGRANTAIPAGPRSILCWPGDRKPRHKKTVGFSDDVQILTYEPDEDEDTDQYTDRDDVDKESRSTSSHRDRTRDSMSRSTSSHRDRTRDSVSKESRNTSSHRDHARKNKGQR